MERVRTGVGFGVDGEQQHVSSSTTTWSQSQSQSQRRMKVDAMIKVVLNCLLEGERDHTVDVDFVDVDQHGDQHLTTLTSP